jgi:hypothetical protein
MALRAAGRARLNPAGLLVLLYTALLAGGADAQTITRECSVLPH